MIFTTTYINDYPLLIAACKVNGDLKLVSVNWVNNATQWIHSKSVNPLLKHHRLSENDVEFIEKHSLSKNDPLHTLLLDTIFQLNEYSIGKRQHFEVPLDLSLGTPFQQSVWRALQEIPYGKTISYAQLAQNIGKPTAYRAAANANGKNPFSIIIPCHRVVASGGGLGGYTGGLAKKRLLLQLESETE